MLQNLLAFTDSQMADAAYLRRLYLTRRALLAKQRKDLLAAAHASPSCLPDPADGVGCASDLAAKLRMNALEDYEVYIKISCAARRGVGHALLRQPFCRIIVQHTKPPPQACYSCATQLLSML